MAKVELPIDSALVEIVGAVAVRGAVIVEAPPGAGKTTRVPPALLSLAGGQRRVVLVEPRRIAARAAAARIAAEEGERLGGRVGYHVRFDRQTSRDTRLTVMTPGILLRELQGDGVLSQVDVVILDEFHERSLECDILLGMIRRIQESIRPELKLVIMSATLNTVSIAEYLVDPVVIRVPGQMYPVSIRHARLGSQLGQPQQSPTRKIIESVSEQIPLAADRDAGDILVFLPGVGEILQTARNIQSQADKHDWEVLPLYGDLSPQEQDRVLAPSSFRKVILATNVAETSLTIDGVRIVIDSGWARVQRVDPAVGLNVLQLEPISQASAEQRAGRAGRTAPGVCYRMWDEVTHRSRPRHTDPEIMRIDLAGAALQLMCWGEHDLSSFPWLTAPRSDALASALQVLERLEAVEGNRPTPLGQQLVNFPTHPRLAKLLLVGHALGIPSAAALAAALLSERDVFDRRGGPSRPITGRSNRETASAAATSDCDVTQRILALDEFLRSGRTEFPQGTIRIGAARQVERAAGQLRDLLRAQAGPVERESPIDRNLAQALLAAMPDRVARRRDAHGPRGLMVGGRGVKLDASSSVRSSELFVCVDVDAAGSEATVRQASAVDRAWLDAKQLRQSDERFVHPSTGQVLTRRRTYWFDLALDETPVPTPLDEETAALLAKSAAASWHKVFPANDKSLQSFLGRARWLGDALQDSEWPDLSDAGLQSQLPDWCAGQRDLDAVRSLPWRALIEAMLTANQRSQLAREAPESYTLPSGRQVLLSYEAGQPPVLAARIQEFFGLRETPRIAEGRVRLLLHLLAPNNRCQQITDDLASFWKNTYQEVRKQLRGRYPKHKWPEDPQTP